MKQKVIAQNISLIFAGVLIAFFITEMGLRLRAKVYLSGKANRNRISLNKKADYRILCLGESTTAEGGWDSYPRQMERFLTERLFPEQVTVINKGSPGVDTGFILSRLEENLDKYDPDIVIVMMGINDKLNNNGMISSSGRSKNIPLGIKNFIKQLKLFKLVKLVHLKIHERQVLKEIYFDRAKYFQEKRNYPKAEKSFKKAIAQDPGDPEAYLEFARYYHEIGNHSGAEGVFSQATGLFPKNADIFQEIGWFYCQQENFNRAQELFIEAIRLDSADVSSCIGLGYSYYAQGKIEMAEAFFERAMAMRPKDEEIFLEIGNYYLERKDYLKAEKIFNAALKLDPGNAEIYVALGNCFNTEGKFVEAERMFKKALEIDPTTDITYQGLGDYYERLQQPSEAERIYQQYVKAVRGTDNYIRQTLRNYKKLKNEVFKRGIRLVCMQYPRRALAPLTQIFDSNKGIVFVDNERIFKDAINKSAYEDYFYDRFAGDFGHCTTEGNGLLAENAARTIAKIILEDAAQ